MTEIPFVSRLAALAGEDKRFFVGIVTIGLIVGSVGLTDAYGQTRSSLGGAGPFLDGVTLGLGLATYHGEMMAEGTFTMGDVLRGGVNAFVGIDKASDPLFFGLEGGFTRIRTRNAWRSFSNHIFRLEGQAGVAIDAIGPDFFRVFSGIALFVHEPRRPGGNWEPVKRNSDFQTSSRPITRVSAAIPLILAIDDHLRIGFRWMMDDYIDNAAGGGIPDFLFHLTLTHRFSLR